MSNTTPKVIARGYAVITTAALTGAPVVSAAVSGPEALRLQRRFGGRIVNARGLAYRTVQGNLRAIVDKAAAIARPTATVR